MPQSPTRSTKPPKLPTNESTHIPSTSIVSPLQASPTSTQNYGALTSEYTSEIKPLASQINKTSLPSRSHRHRHHHHHHHPTSTIAASSSFFGLPSSLSSASLRGNLGLHPSPPGQIDWVSLWVVYWVTLISEASRGLMLPSTWPYFQSLGGTKQLLGVFVASFSIGRMATTIPLGYLSDNYSTSRVLWIASLIQVIGHLLYAISPTLSVLFVSRIIVGFGSATMSVCRAHLTKAVPSDIRTHHFAYLSALQFIGFAILPGLGGLMASLPEKDPLPFIAFNGYTYPAYFLVICNLLSMALIYSFYFNPPESIQRRRVSPSTSDSDESEQSPDFYALVICLLVNITFRGVIAEFETVSTPFLMEQYNMGYSGASFRISLIGFFGLFVYLGFKPIAKRFSDRVLVFFGLLMIFLGCFPLSLPYITQHLSLSTYVFCLGLTWSLAYPVGQTAILALFSKVLAGLPAGGFLGIFSASGSVARVLFAILAGLVWNGFGKEAVFGVILAYISLSAVLVLFSYRRLIPPPEVF